MGFALAQALFVPLSTTIVSYLSTVEIRGRYMGVWTLFWTGGSALGPLLGSLVLAAQGPSAICLVIIAVGLAGAGLYCLLRAKATPTADPKPSPPAG